MKARMDAHPTNGDGAAVPTAEAESVGGRTQFESPFGRRLARRRSWIRRRVIASATLFAALLALSWVPAGGSAAPQGPRVLPLADLSPTIGGDASTAQIAIGPDGTVTAVWHRYYDFPKRNVQTTTRPPGGSFGTPVDLSSAGGDSIQPQVTIGPDGAATAVWQLLNAPNNIIRTASTATPLFALAVTRTGSGQGAVTSNPAGIECGPSSAAVFASYAKVTLTATADADNSFTGWGGACSGMASTCEVTMTETTEVSAGFDSVMPPPPDCTRATLKLGKSKRTKKTAPPS